MVKIFIVVAVVYFALGPIVNKPIALFVVKRLKRETFIEVRKNIETGTTPLHKAAQRDVQRLGGYVSNSDMERILLSNWYLWGLVAIAAIVQILTSFVESLIRYVKRSKE